MHHPAVREKTVFDRYLQVNRIVNEKKLYTRVQSDYNIMQLPRGTFREIKKNELVSSILEEFMRTKFSGICSISSVTVNGTLVFKSGTCILAKIQNKSGDGALEELLKMSDHEIDAALSSLDEAQIQLALEFNKPCRIIKAGKTAPAAKPLQHKPAHTVNPEPAAKSYPIPHTATAPVKPDVIFQKPPHGASQNLRPSSSFTSPPAPVKKVIPPPQARTLPTPQPAAKVQPSPQIPVHHPSPVHKTEKPAEIEEPAQGPSNFENDIDTFDALDLDSVTDKIRNDCKTMIKQLHLEHLMER